MSYQVDFDIFITDHVSQEVNPREFPEYYKILHSITGYAYLTNSEYNKLHLAIYEANIYPVDITRQTKLTINYENIEMQFYMATSAHPVRNTNRKFNLNYIDDRKLIKNKKLYKIRLYPYNHHDLNNLDGISGKISHIKIRSVII